MGEVGLGLLTLFFITEVRYFCIDKGFCDHINSTLCGYMDYDQHWSLFLCIVSGNSTTQLAYLRVFYLANVLKFTPDQALSAS